VTQVFRLIFQGLSKFIDFRSVAIVEKSYGLFYIFFGTGQIFDLLHPTLCTKKMFMKNHLNFFVNKFHGNVLSKMRVLRVQGQTN